jgi:FMN-dependent NADH-azoreductase
MPKLLYIESSPRKERSHSIHAAQAFLTAYRTANPGAEVETWDLWAESLPEFNGATIQAKYNVLENEGHQSPERLAWQQVELLANRFRATDHYLIGVPMWNLGIPYKLKHLIDVIVQPGMTFGYEPARGYFGLVTGKKAAVIYASGGKYGPGSGAEAIDFQQPYLTHILGFMGITEQYPIVVAGTMHGPEAVQEARAHGVAEAERIAKLL